jgi:hypothetical protein
MPNFEKKAPFKSIKLLPCAEHINSLRCYNNTFIGFSSVTTKKYFVELKEEK